LGYFWYFLSFFFFKSISCYGEEKEITGWIVKCAVISSLNNCACHSPDLLFLGLCSGFYMTERDTTGDKGRLKKNFSPAPLKNFCIIIIIIIIIIIRTWIKTKKKNSNEYRSTHLNWQKLILIIKKLILNFKNIFFISISGGFSFNMKHLETQFFLPQST